jgi:hypothetical protein
MGSINSLGYCPFFKVSLKPELAQPPAAAIGHEMKATAVSYVKSLLLFSSRDPQLAQDISNQKQSGALPGKDPCHRRHYALNYCVNSIYSPCIAQRRLGFSRSYFFGTFTAVISNALPFFSLYASQHLPMLRLRARFKPVDAERCA